MGEVTLVTPESGVFAVTLSECHAVVTRVCNKIVRSERKPLFTVIVYLFYPTNCYGTHGIAFASYLFLRAIQKLGLKIYLVSTTSTNSLVKTSHLPVPVRHSSADSLSSGSR